MDGAGDEIGKVDELLIDAPGYDPDLAPEPDYFGDLSGWWGYTPYWGTGYTDPTFPHQPPP